MIVTPSNAKPEDLIADDRAKLAADLLASDVWRLVLLPKLREYEEKHKRACLALHSSPAERAEHIQAAHVIPEIIAFPQSLIDAIKNSR